ncbi:hypothetical protein Q1695_007944 [Nippostrongylus brasiliensis]|nr:hypothetical protein Q1695_007944 [Nippostrongylus brasiliensis]
MDRDVTALLDTGSETSIVPLKIFRKARADGLDLDIYVKRIPGVSAVVRNASGQVMKFLDTIRMPVTWHNRTEDVAFHVGEGLDEIVILGTNALEVFNMQLTAAENNYEVRKEIPEENPGNVVTIKERVFIPPGAAKEVVLVAAVEAGDHLLWSEKPGIDHGVYKVTEDGEAAATVYNNGSEPLVFAETQLMFIYFCFKSHINIIVKRFYKIHN